MLEKLKIVADSIFSRVGEMFADHMVDTGKSLIELNRKLQKLKINSEKLGYIAADLETETNNKELSGRKKRKRQVENWLEMVREIESDFLTLENEMQQKGIVKRLLSGDRVAKMNSRVKSLLEQSRDFNELVLDDPQVTRGEPLLTSIVSGQTFNTVSGRIWECLVVEKVPIIGINGMAGVGKTTLAMHIHDSVLKQTEDHAYWVGVSQREVSIELLQDDIARAIGLTLRHGTDEREKRAAELNRALKRRAGFVLILDGLCNNIDLERAGYPFDVEGCQLIVTSRVLEVCRRIGCRENFELERLGEDDAWNLFKEKIFGQDDGTRTFAPQVEEIAKSMVETCGGLPQGIVEMARQMKGLTELHEWRNELAQLEEQGLFRGDD